MHVAGIEGQVDVNINEAGKARRLRQIDDLGAGRRFSSQLRDSTIANDDGRRRRLTAADIQHESATQGDNISRMTRQNQEQRDGGNRESLADGAESIRPLQSLARLST